MKLHLYFVRKFLFTFLGLMAAFFVLQSLLDLVDQTRRFQAQDVSFGGLIQLTLLNVPQGLYQILPLVMILSTIALFLGLARSSELVVVRAAGRSALKALAAPAVVAFLIGVLVVAMFNPIVAATSKRYHELSQSLRDGGSDVLSISADGLWLRQGGTGGAEGQTVIRAASANPEATVLYDVSFLVYSPSSELASGPVRRIEAREARLEPGAWLLSDAVSWPLLSGVNPEAKVERSTELKFPSTLTQERILESFGAPNAISIWELPRFIAQLDQAGFSTRRHSVWMQMELAQPLFLLAMVLVGAAFTMRQARGGGTGFAVLASVLLGFGLYYIRNFAQVLGENGQIPVMLAAWAPPAASILLAWGLILHKEDG
ncbi:LPS export ABC transporter permease LptG [Lentibacter algarum]|uniref:LPS export ABC transporter permease LptG n=1 Tax=Lentibacter algarum TaxID=576131 RepID=UPI001C08AB26|nr:LPS export ABC transporter permease LptG [Lentibacter algarum]MBU2982768.1 LPS export ABC transporter permease LptG [Lentibacter algarum]